MGFFKHHTKAPQEATTNTGTHTSEFTSLASFPKEADAKKLNGSSFGITTHEKWGRENSISSGGSASDGLAHEKGAEQKQKHHFWEKRNKDDAKAPADQGGKQTPPAPRRRSSIFAAWPLPGDPLGEGNLNQGFTWR